MLHFGDQFNTRKVLEQIAATVSDRQVVGAAIDLEYDGNLFEAKKDYLSFSRSADGIINPKI